MKVNIQVIRMAARLVALPPLFGIKLSLVGWLRNAALEQWSQSWFGLFHIRGLYLTSHIRIIKPLQGFVSTNQNNYQTSTRGFEHCSFGSVLILCNNFVASLLQDINVGERVMIACGTSGIVLCNHETTHIKVVCRKKLVSAKWFVNYPRS